MWIFDHAPNPCIVQKSNVVRLCGMDVEIKKKKIEQENSIVSKEQICTGIVVGYTT